MRSVVDRNVVMRRIPAYTPRVILVFKVVNFVPRKQMCYHLNIYLERLTSLQVSQR
jgi:hypothetical protein